MAAPATAPEAAARPARRSGLELARIAAALMIVARHFVGENALDVSAQALSPAKWACQVVLYGSGKVGVVLFFLVSAWFLADERSLRSCLRRVWLMERELLFWGLGILAAMLALSPGSLGARSVLGAFVPLLTGLWWYPTAYAAFLVLLPFLSAGLRALGRRAHGALCACLLVAFGALSGVTPSLGLGMAANSVWVMCFLFALASWWRWYGRVPRARAAWGMVGAGVALATLWFLACELGASLVGGGARGERARP